jgi:hypothetical protein
MGKASQRMKRPAQSITRETNVLQPIVINVAFDALQHEQSCQNN